MKKNLIIALLGLCAQLSAQLVVPVSGANEYTVCSGTLYDSGGQSGSYSNNSNGYAILNPSSSGNMIQLSGGAAGENSSDFIQIYNGAGLTGNLLWQGSPGIGTIPTITSTAGPLTVLFTSNFTNAGAGFALDITCVPPATFTVPTSGINNYTVCSGVLYDSGGPSGNYSNDANGYTVLTPSNPGNMVQISGTFSGQNCCDFLRIYNGTGLSGNLLWEGNPSVGTVPTITSTVGPLTVQFVSNGSVVGTGFALDILCLPPQTFVVPFTGSNEYTVCSGTLYDSGGPLGNYSNNSSGYAILNPSNPGNMIQVSGGASGENSSDFIQIYNGAGLSGNLLWEGVPGVGTIPTITSTAGPLTVRFTSNGSNGGAGFALDINCVTPATFTVPISGENSYTVCSGVLYDSGGPSGNYSDNSNGYTVLNPSNPGNVVQISGSFTGQNCCDFLRIYNGTGLGGNLLWDGNPSVGIVPTITSTTGPLTVQFVSNGSVVGTGFALDVLCLPPQTFVVPFTGSNEYTVCSGTLYDSGGQFGNYSNNSSGYAILNPSNPGNMIQVSGGASGENSSDFIQIYNGAGLSGNLLWEGVPGVGTIPTITSTAGPLTVRFTTNSAIGGAGFALDIICVPPTTFIVPTTGINTYTVCSGVLYDSGGPSGNYTDDSNGYTVLIPSNPGNMMRIGGTFTGQNCCDFLRIYNGEGLGGNLLWEGNPSVGTVPTITSTDGALTVQFVSNGSIVGAGFALDIICVPPQTFVVPFSGVNEYTVCSGKLYDSGGPLGGYSNNSSGYAILNPSNPGNMIQVSGGAAGESFFDFIQIYNGSGLSGNLLWEGSPGIGTIPTITSTAGPLTIRFTSNGTSAGAGFELDIDCVPPTTFIVPTAGFNNYTVCSGVLYDSGGPSGNYTDDSNGYTVLTPSNPGNMMRIGGTFTGQNCCDILRIYNGAGLSGNLLWEGNSSVGTVPTITSTAGPLTVHFVSNGSNVGTGFALDIICVPPQTFVVPFTGINEYTVCSGTLYDSGGPLGGYSNNSSGYTILNPSNPGNMIQVNGGAAGENFFDFIQIFNGAGLSGTLLWEGSPGIGTIPTITSTAGPLTVRFTSNSSNAGAGFALDINCVQSGTCTPTIVISSNQGTSICVGQEVTFSASIINGGTNPGFQWKRNGSVVGTSPTYVSSAVNNGDAITCELTSNATCASVNLAVSNTLNMVVNNVATPSFTQVQPICAGTFLSPLPTTSTNGISGTWTPVLNTSSTTTYTFSPNGGQCATTATMTITVNPNTSPNFPQFGPFCSGQQITPLPGTSTNGISGSWSPPINNTQTTTYTFIPNGSQCATTASTIIQINNNPNVDLQFDGSILTASAGYSAYSWTLNGVPVADENTNQLGVIGLGVYEVTVVNANGCIGTASFDVQIVGINGEIQTSAFSIFPNPSNGSSTLSALVLEAQQVNLVIHDLQGKILFQQSYTFDTGKNEVLLDLSSLDDGVYFVQLENSNFKNSKRLVKIRN